MIIVDFLNGSAAPTRLNQWYLIGCFLKRVFFFLIKKKGIIFIQLQQKQEHYIADGYKLILQDSCPSRQKQKAIYLKKKKKFTRAISPNGYVPHVPLRELVRTHPTADSGCGEKHKDFYISFRIRIG